MKTQYFMFVGYPSEIPSFSVTVRVSRSEFEHAVDQICAAYPLVTAEWRVNRFWENPSLPDEIMEECFLNGRSFGYRVKGGSL